MPDGQIIKAISGFYYVQTAEQEIFRCRARGKFKFQKKKQTPLVGDLVQFDKTGLGEGVITFIQPRTTELKRPPIANVDQAVVVCSLREPKFQQMPLDRLLVHAEYEKLDIVICLTKKDLIDSEEEIEKVRSIYSRAGYPIIVTSILTKEGLEELRKALVGKVSVFAGQSGVGKSSLLNCLLTDQNLQTGEVSRKIGRGRHTTRQVELLSFPEGGQVADTPGFSQLSFQGMEVDQLKYLFPEFADHNIGCRYRGCMHEKEPDCRVREGVEEGEIARSRYQHYLHFLAEIKDQRRF